MLQKVHHVLVIEDDPVTIEVIQGALEQFNFRVSTVSDGQLALSKLRTYSYDLVLCDIMLPHLDGLNALERAREKLHATPIVMVTALSDKDSVLRAREIGAAGYLRKPFTVDQLLERVREVCRVQKMDLIDKRRFPFQGTAARDEDGVLRMNITGCPSTNPVRELYARLGDVLARFPTIKKIVIDVAEEFAYEPKALDYLSSLAGMLSRNAGISRMQLDFSGPFFTTSESEEMVKFRASWHVLA